MTRDEILAEINARGLQPIAFEALWDGDTTGWFVRFSAITADLQTHCLTAIRHGGDLRLFNGQVPPWPEAATATELGQEVAALFRAEFYFPSPVHPEDACPRWIERDKGQPCQRCTTLLLQPDSCPWRGVCHHCHSLEEQELRTAGWTEAERAGPKCQVCFSPASAGLGARPICEECFAKYEVYACERCGLMRMTLKTADPVALCASCKIQQTVDALSEEQRQEICQAFSQGELWGVKVTKQVMGCSLLDAQHAAQLIKRQDQQQ
ncbi:hypothetical protein [Anatilimnocola floriformis]|uniref:hypothetical protein n=1 Tax=Anatilimnocola floriformis TaxID=2948575 RepID=UPI0020C267A7|nr:hypothetical protein [Anatilimnocola floriformis]